VEHCNVSLNNQSLNVLKNLCYLWKEIYIRFFFKFHFYRSLSKCLFL